MVDLCSKCGGDIRTMETHNHQFAEISNLFHNLPETHRAAPYAKSANAFRKHGLIETGYCDIQTLIFTSKQDATTAAPVMAKLNRELHGYALVSVRGNVLVCTTPHSQSMKAMGGKVFNASKQAVLEWGKQLLGCDD